MQWLWWVLGALLLLGGGIWAYMEYHVYLLRTSVTDVTGGVRFFSQDLIVEAQRSAKQVLVHTRRGTYTHQPADGADAEVESGEIEHSLPAIGLKIDVIQHTVKVPDEEEALPTGMSQIVFSASDELVCALEERSGGERTVLRIDGVPNKVAADFHLFANRIRIWVEKLEQHIEQELEARRKAIEEQEAAAKAEAEAKAKAEALAARLAASQKPTLSPEEREAATAPIIAQWRKAAGFAGTSSEISVTPQGEIEWFIDLDPRGRITLHAGNRTIHTTLRGASIQALDGEIEVGVRDDYWSEADPALKNFRILKGLSPDARRAWQERLEVLRDSLPR